MLPPARSAQGVLERLARPIDEMRYLLVRGYPRASVIRFVGDHHQLSVLERNVLERVVFTAEEAERRKKRLLTAHQIRDRALVIDGYNVLISIACLHSSEMLFACDDGVVRDIAARKGLDEELGRTALMCLVDALLKLGAASAAFIFDQQVSRSGELAGACRRLLDSRGLRGEARTESRADRALIEAAPDAVICSSDRVIIDASPSVFDIVAHLARAEGVLGGPDSG